MYETILVPTDGSEVAERAATYAVDLAERFDAALRAVYVEEAGGLVGREGDDVGDRALAAVVEAARGTDLEVTTEAIDADEAIHREILGYVDDQDVDLVVMGTTGRGGLGRFLVGSVAEQTLRESPVPVATVHGETDLDRALDRIVVPTDGSAGARAATDHGVDLAGATGGRLHLVHVSDEPTEAPEFESFDRSTLASGVGVAAVDEVVDPDRLREAGVDTVDVSVVEGRRVDQTVLALAAEHDADCLVTGTHGRAGIRQHLLGSTTERLVRFATVPVVAVSAPRIEAATVEYLDYRVVDERGWSLDDEDLFETAAETDLGGDEHGTFVVAEDEYLLDAAESEGLEWPFHCRAGGCVNCAAVLYEGEVEMDVQRSLSEDEVASENLRLTCVATPTSESIKLVYNAKHLDLLRDRVV